MISPRKPIPRRLKNLATPFLVILSLIFFIREKGCWPASCWMQKKGLLIQARGHLTNIYLPGFATLIPCAVSFLSNSFLLVWTSLTRPAQHGIFLHSCSNLLISAIPLVNKKSTAKFFTQSNFFNFSFITYHYLNLHIYAYQILFSSAVSSRSYFFVLL